MKQSTPACDCTKRALSMSAPTLAVERLLDAVDLPGGRWVDPCAVRGDIIRAVQTIRDDVEWTAFGLWKRAERKLREVPETREIRVQPDFPTLVSEGGFDVCISKPGLTSSHMFVPRGISKYRALLLPLSSLPRELSTNDDNMPDIYVLPTDLDGHSGSRSIGYAWCVWSSEDRRRCGRTRLLRREVGGIPLKKPVPPTGSRRY